jgi:hypothetical protein
MIAHEAGRHLQTHFLLVLQRSQASIGSECSGQRPEANGQDAAQPGSIQSKTGRIQAELSSKQ